ncbi:MAG: hypothetical protein WBP85_11035 [Terracidiphilus sp.]
MKSPAGKVAWLLPFLVTGCFHVPFHKKHPIPVTMDAPSLQPSQTLKVVDIPLPPKDSVIAGYPIYNMPEQTEPIRPPKHKKVPPPDDVANAPEPPSPATPEVSAIGTLSSGDPAGVREQTENSIADIERRLNNVGRPLSDAEQRTADHIREFLKQARAALASGDVEGAHTLAGKAEVLLAELTK